MLCSRGFKQILVGWVVLPVCAQTDYRLIDEGPKEAKVEQIYRFRTYRYESAMTIVARMLEIEATSRKTPEEALIRMVSAMARGDYSLWYTSWEQAGQKIISDRDKKFSRTEADWKRAWSALLPGKSLSVSKRIETGKYVILPYSLTKQDVASVESQMVFKQIGTEWFATEELTGDPVLQLWNSSPPEKMTIVR